MGSAMATPSFRMRNRYRPQDYTGYGQQQQQSEAPGDYMVDPNTSDPYGGQTAYESGPNQGAPPSEAAPLHGYANQYQGGFDNTNDPTQMIQQNRMRTAGMGDAINQATVDAQNRYGGLEEGYRQQADSAYGQLKQTPGYTPDEAYAINADYNQFRTTGEQLQDRYLSPTEEAQIAGDPRSALAYRNPGLLSGIAEDASARQGAAVEGYKKDLTGAIDQDALKQSQDYREQAGGALDREEAGLNAAVDENKLGLDPSFAGRQLSDADVQAMKTASGVRVGNQYRSAVDDLERRAAAEGNTSPLAIAAARARLERQSAADSGAAEAEADINARQAQFGRAKDIESMRGEREQDISGRRMSNAQTIGQQRTGQAGEQEAMRIGAEQYRTGANLSAADKAGQAAIDRANRDWQQRYETETHNEGTGIEGERYGEAQASQRAQGLAENRQNTVKGMQDTAYTQGMQATAATGQGAQTVGDARRQGGQEYRGYLTGQQQQAQQGGETARGQQISAYGTQTGALNQQAQTKASYDIGQKGTPGAGERIGMGILNALFDEGGIVTQPTVGVVGENGPEAVVPVGGPRPAQRYQSSRFAQAMSATPVGQVWNAMRAKKDMGPPSQSGTVVNKPTVMMLGDKQPEAVVPLNRNPRNRVPPAAQVIARYRGVGG